MPLPCQCVSQRLEELGAFLAREFTGLLREQLPVVARFDRSAGSRLEKRGAGSAYDGLAFRIECDFLPKNSLNPGRYIDRQNQISLNDGDERAPVVV